MALVHGVDVLDQGLLVHYPLGEPIVVGIDTCCLFLLGWEVQTGDADRAADRSDPLELMRSGRSITRYFFLLKAERQRVKTVSLIKSGRPSLTA
jgi:hypothetical protein